jgi:SPP1 family predicted phage head-tail adaptor
MIARNYTRLVSFYRTENVSDGFGGNTVLDLSIGNYWAEVKQMTSNNDTSQGKDVLKNNYSFVIRVNQFIEPYLNNLSIIYNGQKYVVNNYEYQDSLFRFIKITSTLSIGEPLDLITDLLLQNSFILISQNEDNLIFQ